MRRGTRKIAAHFVPVVVISGILFLSGCGSPISGLVSANTGNLSTDTTNQMAREVLRLTNQERSKSGLSTLAWNDALALAGADHCQDMIDRNYFAHESPDGSNPGSRGTAAGYQWQLIGENIAAGQETPQAVVQGWMNSKDHRENILRAEFKDLGVGLRAAPDGRIYWAQEFGTPFSQTW